MVLKYLIDQRDDPVARRIFCSEIERRARLPCEVVDAVAEELLEAIVSRQDRVGNEALLRRLIPIMSDQIKVRTVRTILSIGTRVSRRYVLRMVTPADIPDIRNIVLELAVGDRDADALFGIIYHWPLEWWRDQIDAVFEAAEDQPWLQRQVIFKTGEVHRFLEKGAIRDPVTELYVRARYAYPITTDLIAAAIKVVNLLCRVPDLDRGILRRKCRNSPCPRQSLMARR